MKKIILFSLLLVIASSGFSQQNNPSPAFTKQDYLKKTKHQKNTAWILLGGGTIAWLAGASKYMNQDDGMGGTKGKPAMAIGSIAALASVPFFIAASKNKKKAATVGFRMEHFPAVQQQNLVYHSYPAFSFNIALQ